MSAKKRPACSMATEVAVEGGPCSPRRVKGDLRGLLINTAHIGKFMAPILSRKTHEVRSHNCRVVSKNTTIYLLEAGLKDSNKRGAFRVAALAEFRGNTFVTHEDFMKHHSKHRCTQTEYDQLRSGWAQDKGGCVLWELIVTKVFDDPRMYLLPRQGEDR